MNTYVFTEKDGNASITLSADNEQEAYDYLKGITKVDFRLDCDLSISDDE